VIPSKHLCAPLVGAVAMTLACAICLAAAVLGPEQDLYAWGVATNTAVYGGFAFLFARTWRSLARARRSEQAAHTEEALGDLTRALEFSGGLAVLTILGAVLFTIGAGVATLMH
jgi:hypothetical protein